MKDEDIVLPECFKWRLYDGNWECKNFEGSDTFFALKVKGFRNILYGRIWPKITGKEYIYIFVPCMDDLCKWPIVLMRGCHYISEVVTYAYESISEKISYHKKIIEKLEAKELNNIKNVKT